MQKGKVLFPHLKTKKGSVQVHLHLKQKGRGTLWKTSNGNAIHRYCCRGKKKNITIPPTAAEAALRIFLTFKLVFDVKLLPEITLFAFLNHRNMWLCKANISVQKKSSSKWMWIFTHFLILFYNCCSIYILFVCINKFLKVFGESHLIGFLQYYWLVRNKIKK